MSLSRSDDAVHHRQTISVIMRLSGGAGTFLRGGFIMNRDEALRLLKGGPEGVAEWNRLRNAGGRSVSRRSITTGRLSRRSVRRSGCWKLINRGHSRSRNPVACGGLIREVRYQLTSSGWRRASEC